MNHSGRRGLYYFSFGELDLRGIRFCPIKLNLIKFAVKDFIVQGFNFPNSSEKLVIDLSPPTRSVSRLDDITRVRFYFFI